MLPCRATGLDEDRPRKRMLLAAGGRKPTSSVSKQALLSPFVSRLQPSNQGGAFQANGIQALTAFLMSSGRFLMANLAVTVGMCIGAASASKAGSAS